VNLEGSKKGLSNPPGNVPVICRAKPYDPLYGVIGVIGVHPYEGGAEP